MFLNSRALGDELATVVDQARREGVTRLVALSAINADDDFSRQPSRFRGDRNKEVEQYAVDSGLEWVSLRPTVFVTNFFGMWAPQIKAGDVVNGPYAAASTAPIVDSDISAVAARALLTDDLLGQKVPLTGPQALTNAELVDVIGTVLGRPLRYQEVPAGSRAAALHRYRVLGRVRRRVHGIFWRRPWPSPHLSPTTSRRSSAVRRRASATRSPRIANCSPTSKGDKTMSELRPPRYLKPMNGFVRAVQRLGIPTGPAMVLTVPGQEDR